MIQIDANAYQFIDEVNGAFLEAGLTQPLNESMNAVDAVNALNIAFSSYSGKIEITTSMDADDIIAVVNNNLSLIEGNSTIKFLHISDIHNHASADAINYCKTLMDGDNTLKFTFLTGDYSGYNGSYYYMTPPLQSLGNKIFVTSILVFNPISRVCKMLLPIQR